MKTAPWITVIVFLLGLAAITAGCWILHPAAGLIVGGTLVAYIAHRLDVTAGSTPPAGAAS